MSNLVPTMVDVAREAGVSVVTVDRVLNRRATVRPATERKVLDAAQRLNFALGKVQSVRGDLATAAPPTRAATLAFFLLRSDDAFYQSIAQALSTHLADHPGVHAHRLYYLDGLSPAQCAELLLEQGAGADAIAIVCPDHPLINQAVDKLGQAGVWVYAYVSDITASQCAGYFGIDNRKAGRTAAWAISRLSRRPGKVAIMVGDYRYLCQELTEISFRSYFREVAPTFEVIDTLLTLESSAHAGTVTRELLRLHPDLVGLYASCGGEAGIIDALRDSPRRRDIVVITHDLVDSTRDGFLDGTVDMTLSLPIEESVTDLIDLMVIQSKSKKDPALTTSRNRLFPFSIATVESL